MKNVVKKVNSVIVGGSIAVGKSSLVKSLELPYVQELDPNDQLQKLLLEEMYQGSLVAKKIFQLDLMLNRYNNYRQKMASEILYVFDRSILEDYIFAKIHLKHAPNVWQYYLDNWNYCVDDMLKNVGTPKLYILLDCSWDVFKKRLFKRGRTSEISHWEKNKKLFYHIYKDYIPYMEKLLKKLNIPYVVIDTDQLTQSEVVKFAKKEIKSYVSK